jgi:Family of unknown function (DUF6204)
VALHIFRVTVRGQFASLDDSARAVLVADAPRHTVAQAAFTRTGTFTYELPLISFSYRFEIRVDDEDDDPPMPAATARAEASAIADLIARGIVARHLRVEATDMAEMWRRDGAS